MIVCDKARPPDLGVLEVDYRAIVAEEVHLFDPRNVVDTQSLQRALFQVRTGQGVRLGAVFSGFAHCTGSRARRNLEALVIGRGRLVDRLFLPAHRPLSSCPHLPMGDGSVSICCQPGRFRHRGARAA